MGLAFASYVAPFVRAHPEAVDYVEVAFEQLEHDSNTLSDLTGVPIVLHCSSLSIAGTVEPSAQIVDAVRRRIVETNTPWLGEHLAFLLAEPTEDESPGQPPYNVGYTMSPQMSAETVELASRRARRLADTLGVPLLLENSPMYFHVPGSTLDQPEFIQEVCTRADVGLLLDLTHFFITARNLSFDPFEAIERLPLERVVEIHLSGVSQQSGRLWDNHAAMVPAVILDLYARALARARPRAVTLEYNWLLEIPPDRLQRQIETVRAVLAGATAA